MALLILGLAVPLGLVASPRLIPPAAQCLGRTHRPIYGQNGHGVIGCVASGPVHAGRHTPQRVPHCQLCFFEEVKRTFQEARTMATVQHLLVDDVDKCQSIKDQIAAADGELPVVFGEFAAAHSSCPSAPRGGAIGPFGKGQMVNEFEKVAFREEIGQVHGPVKTKYGYHLVLINKRRVM